MPSVKRKKDIEPVKLAFDYNDYNIYALKTRHTDKELSTEYSRLRSIARKRLERLSKSEFADSDIYRAHKDKFVSVKEAKKAGELPYLLIDVQRFLYRQTSTVTGQKLQRERNISTLHEHGYTFITEENYKEFTLFMDYVKTVTTDLQLSSERIAELFEQFDSRSISMEEMKKYFDSWLKHEIEEQRKAGANMARMKASYNKHKARY